MRSATAQGFRQQILKLTTKEGLDVVDEDEKKKLGELKIEFVPLAMIMWEVLGVKVEMVIVSCSTVDSPCIQCWAA